MSLGATARALITRSLRGLGTVAIIALITVAITEITARFVPGLPSRVRSLEPERAWEDRFLEMMHKDGTLVVGGFHRPHPTRGWTVAPNAHQVVDGFRYTTNERGYRSLRPYTPDSAKYTVLVIGDSFTFGIDTNDEETWPYLLETKDPGLNVINLGVGGYGIDQMDVTLQETVGVYHPDLVIIAFIGDDLRRTFLSFRDYKKPRFVLDRGGVRLTNVPIGTPDAVTSEIESRRRWFDHSYTFGLLRGLTRVARGYTMPPADKPLPTDAMELDTRLLDQMRDVSRRNGAEFLLVYLSYGEGLFDANLTEEGEAFLRNYGEHAHVPTLDTRPAFLRQHRVDWVKGHYQGRENQVVSAAIYERILPLMSSASRSSPH